MQQETDIATCFYQVCQQINFDTLPLNIADFYKLIKLVAKLSHDDPNKPEFIDFVCLLQGDKIFFCCPSNEINTNVYAYQIYNRLFDSLMILEQLLELVDSSQNKKLQSIINNLCKETESVIDVIDWSKPNGSFNKYNFFLKLFELSVVEHKASCHFKPITTLLDSLKNKLSLFSINTDISTMLSKKDDNDCYENKNSIEKEVQNLIPKKLSRVSSRLTHNRMLKSLKELSYLLDFGQAPKDYLSRMP